MDTIRMATWIATIRMATWAYLDGYYPDGYLGLPGRIQFGGLHGWQRASWMEDGYVYSYQDGRWLSGWEMDTWM